MVQDRTEDPRDLQLQALRNYIGCFGRADIFMLALRIGMRRAILSVTATLIAVCRS